MAHRILIVDDREDLRAFLVDAITSTGDEREIVCASNGVEALAAVANRPVDLVITDLDMPVMNGVELIRRLRATPPVPPIVVISGASIDWIAGEATHELADLPMLRKPLALAELLATVRAELVR